MADSRAPHSAHSAQGARMTNEEYFRCLETGALARTPDEVARVRQEVRQRWRGDPRADDLAEALYAHEERLSRTAGDAARHAPRGRASEAGRNETRYEA